mmetsp:Transcript_10934/g.24822  ORF Transcript_10934/g.24822 Transcript_10934/m.24822 type:complete len:211 (-) Transcript_10934:1152-1784(-)
MRRHGSPFRRVRLLERLEGKPHSSLVRNVFAQRRLPVHVVSLVPIRHLAPVLAVLLRKTVCPLVKLFERLAVPPVLLVAVLVQQVPRIVEPVRHLMTADGSKSSVVAGVVVGLRVEGRLDDAGGDPKAVDHRAVEGVDNDGIGFPPAVSLRRLKDSCLGSLHSVRPDDVDVTHVVVLRQLPDVSEDALRPIVRVPDLEEHVVKLLLRRLP